MKTVLLLTATILLLVLSTAVFSQKNITWKGGTPGMENAWDCTKNWSTYQVPDEWSNVIIPDVSTSSLAYPVIRSGEVSVNALFVHPDAKLNVANDAALVILFAAEGLEYVTGNVQVMQNILDDIDPHHEEVVKTQTGKKRYLNPPSKRYFW